MQVQHTPRVTSESGPTVLEAVGLAAGYNNAPVVSDIDLRVKAGEIVALLGPNGAGKSTIMQALAGALKPLAGSVRLFEEPAPKTLHQRARRGMGYVPEQRSVIRSLTTKGNLRLGRGPLDKATDLFPELVPLLGRKAGLLSGGEQQILGVARALAASPRVMMADELSLGLAPMVVRRLLDALSAAAERGVGVLLVEQQISAALHCAHRGIIVTRGRVVMEGSSEELLSRMDEMEAKYFTSQSTK